MDYEGLNNNEIKASDNDWLDVHYTAKRYLETETEEIEPRQEDNPRLKRKISGFVKRKQLSGGTDEQYLQAAGGEQAVQQPKKRNKVLLRLSIVALVLALLVGAFFIADSFMDGQLRQLAKETFIVPVFGGGTNSNFELSVPCNINVDNVDGGVITFSGGSVVLSFTGGSVSEVTENSLTVAINDNTSITYNGITHCYVASGDTVAVNQLLAKFTDSASATIFFNGEQVQNVIGSETLITWSV
jgi:hypothetical protein